MLIFAHLGIGSKLVSPWTRRLPKRWVFFGTLLPDILDKSVYYTLVLITGLHGDRLGLISGTRTFGHTAIFSLGMSFIAFARKSKPLAALCLGMATHLLLDTVSNQFTLPSGQPTLNPLLWPWIQTNFPMDQHQSIGGHLNVLVQPVFFIAELIGLTILSWDLWRWRRIFRTRMSPKP